ncbi:sulfotransferase family protein [Aphanothece sacrum]|uniref:sulfotransferase family protein n=1 Tax=Aphanothece sacrum TaxID=1122 RepID=UPI000FF95737|nr:sulfotransferase [Aphanothece sacrum]GBF85383.1 sulfotransferase [Aphanothece sacrum FPU3]
MNNNDISIISQPIFLVGAERSGTTLLRLMLSDHSQICWCPEFEYVVDKFGDDGIAPNLDQYYEWLETHWIFQATDFIINQSLDYNELVNSFLCQQLERENKKIVGATVHRHFDRLPKIWPDAPFYSFNSRW